MAFTDDLIRAAVQTGQYSDPAAAGHLVAVLMKRRDAIGRDVLDRHQPGRQSAARRGGQRSRSTTPRSRPASRRRRRRTARHGRISTTPQESPADRPRREVRPRRCRRPQISRMRQAASSKSTSPPKCRASRVGRAGANLLPANDGGMEACRPGAPTWRPQAASGPALATRRVVVARRVNWRSRNTNGQMRLAVVLTCFRRRHFR